MNMFCRIDMRGAISRSSIKKGGSDKLRKGSKTHTKLASQNLLLFRSCSPAQRVPSAG
jgi:hypothetical protein